MCIMIYVNDINEFMTAKPVRRYIPKNRLQYQVWWLVTSQAFEYVIFILILINTITLAMKFHGQPTSYTHALDVLNMVFTAVFALEFVLKLAAFRFKVSNHFVIKDELTKFLLFLLKNLNYVHFHFESELFR